MDPSQELMHTIYKNLPLILIFVFMIMAYALQRRNKDDR
jgi:hypothetical protein